MRWQVVRQHENIKLLVDGRRIAGWVIEHMFFTEAYLPPARQLECRLNPYRHGQLLGVWPTTEAAQRVTEQACERLKIRQ